MKNSYIKTLCSILIFILSAHSLLAQNALVVNTTQPGSDTIPFSQIRSIKYATDLMRIYTTGDTVINYITTRVLDYHFVQLCDTPTGAMIAGIDQICDGASTVFTASCSNPSANVLYEWSGPSGFFSNNASTGNITQAGTYTCFISNGPGCAAMVLRTLALSPNLVPSVSTNVFPGNSVCEGTQVQFTAIPVNGGANPAYQWRVNGVNVLGENSAQFSYQYTGTGNSVSVAMISSETCITAATVSSTPTQVTVNPSAFGLSVAANNTLLSPPFLVSFSNNTPTPQNYEFTWNFGDGTQYIGQTPPPHLYSLQGTYSPALFASNLATGCTDSLFLQDYIQCIQGSPNFCNEVVNLSPAGNAIGCQGSSVVLSAVTSAANPLFQWSCNGTPIGGASDDTLITSLPGVYRVTVYSSDGCLLNSAGTTVSFTLPALPPPGITVSGTVLPCQSSQVVCTSQGTYNSYQWSNGATDNFMTTTNSGIYQLMVTDAQGCTALSDPMVLNASITEAPQICMSTVDYLNNGFVNTIIWEKPLSAQIDSFFVFKETLPGVWRKIGARAYEDSSIYLDYTTNANLMSEKYRLVVLDSCGGRSLPGYVHETMHLQVVPGTDNNRFLSWNSLLGINVDRYIIESGPSYNQFTPIDSVPATQNTYLDTNPVFGTNARYRVSVRLSSPCTPGKSMMQGRVRSTSNGGTNNVMLQVDPASLVNTRFLPPKKIQVLAVPNPSDGGFRLVQEGGAPLPLGTTLQVWDVSGRLVHRGLLPDDSSPALQHLQGGCYQLGYNIPGYEPGIIRIALIQNSK